MGFIDSIKEGFRIGMENAERKRSEGSRGTSILGGDIGGASLTQKSMNVFPNQMDTMDLLGLKKGVTEQ